MTPLTLALPLYLLIGLSVGMLVYWLIVAYHIGRTMRRIPTVRAALVLPQAGPHRKGLPLMVCVVIPAHNEAENIGPLVASLKGQDYRRDRVRIVFSLDRCTDSTLDALQRAWGEDDTRLEIVEVNQCPPDWVGKCHALHRAVRHSVAAKEADVLLFLDADTVLDPGCIRATVALLEHRSLDMLSVLSTLTADRWFERLVQPAAGMELLRQYPIIRANAREHRRAFANGQFIMIRRSAYETIGGHEAVKSEVLEDVALARHVAMKGLPAGVFLADGMLRCRMHTTWESFRRGWLRVYNEGAHRRPRRLRTSARRIWALGVFMPLGALVCIGAGVAVLSAGDVPLGCAAVIAGAAGLGAWLGTLGIVYYLGRVPLWTVPGYPIGAWLVGTLLWEAARDLERGQPTVWGGKEYHREVR